MHQALTPNHLVQFLYREVPAEFVPAITEKISSDAQVASQYSAYRSAKLAMPKVQFNPSQSALDRIMRYSAETAV